MKIEPTKEFACTLGVMLNSRLIWYKHFHPFCDEIILESTKPPYWIIELATVRYQGAAIEIVNNYIHSEPFITYYNSKHFDQYIACLYIKYERRELSWASLLLEAGEYADGCEAVKEPCEYFFELSNEYEAEEFDIELEHKQRIEIQKKFQDEIMEVQEIYHVFKDYFKQYVKKEREISN